MKFVVVILSVIAIANYIGQAAAYTIQVTVTSMTDTGSYVLRATHGYVYNEVHYLETIRQGDLTYCMKLEMDGEVVDSVGENDYRDFCEDSLEAKILRGALLSKGRTSCPVRKAHYKIPNVYDVNISDTEGTKLKCGEYSGKASVLSDNNSVVDVEFTFDLDENQNNCSE